MMRLAALFGLAGALLVAGCSSGPPEMTKEEDARLREAINKPFDINNVPKEQRAQVEAFMKQGRGGGQAPAPSQPK